jgi:hypothetical protein
MVSGSKEKGHAWKEENEDYQSKEDQEKESHYCG